MRTAAAPGWYGKLPSLGDFAARRLDDSFITPWDGWLAAGLLALRQAQPEAWLEQYLGSPSWRFLLMPGVLAPGAGSQAWAGVLMPSVDRVGRYFPLTLVQPLGPGPATAQQMAGLWHWLGRLDELARDALYEDWTAEQLEDELARMAEPDLQPLQAAPADPCPDVEGSVVEVMQAAGAGAQAAGAAGLDVALYIGAEAQRGWAERAAGRAWWFARPDDAPARLLLSRGLPDAASLARLFGAAATI